MVSLHYLSFLTSNIAEPINDEDANGRFALVATSSCYLYHGYPWSDSLPTSIHNQLESIAHDAFQKYPQYIDQLYSDLIKPVFVKAASHPDVSTAGRKIFRGDHGELERLSHTFSMFSWTIRIQGCLEDVSTSFNRTIRNVSSQVPHNICHQGTVSVVLFCTMYSQHSRLPRTCIQAKGLRSFIDIN